MHIMWVKNDVIIFANSIEYDVAIKNRVKCFGNNGNYTERVLRIFSGLRLVMLWFGRLTQQPHLMDISRHYFDAVDVIGSAM